MASSSPSRFLTHDSDDRGHALKLWWGKVIEAFRGATKFYDNMGNIYAGKNISEGKSWQFEIMGDDPTPEYHTPGDQLLGQAISLDQGTVTIDDILVAHCDVPLDHQKMSHFEILAPFAKKLGRAVAREVDLHICYTALLAARTAAVSGYHSGGNRVQSAVNGDIGTAFPDTAAGATDYRDAAANLAQLMDEDEVPEEGRFLFIPPYIRRILRHETDIFNADYNRTPNNDLNNRIIGTLEGFMVIQTNRLPSTNVNTGPTHYQDDFTYDGTTDGRPCGLALCGAQEGSAAVGFVQAGPLFAHMEDDHRRNTTFMKAQIMCGSDVLAPWCAGEIYCASS